MFYALTHAYTVNTILSQHLALLNIPYYPLLRREVDCMIALDASADSQVCKFLYASIIVLTLKRIYGLLAPSVSFQVSCNCISMSHKDTEYASRRGLSTWPKGARWPALLQSASESDNESTKVFSDAKMVKNNANRALAEAQEKEASGQAKKVSEPEGTSFTGAEDSKTRGSRLRSLDQPGLGDNERLSAPRPIGACNIWMGSSTGSQEPTPLEKLEEEDLMRRDGIAIVYNPLIPNKVVPEFDPMGVSTWLFSMEKEESEKLLKVSQVGA